MKFNLLFIWFLYGSIFILVMLAIKTVVHTRNLKRMAKREYAVLEMQLEMQTEKLYKNNQRLILVNDLHETLFSRFFKIIQDVLLMQKFIFETYIK